MWTDMCSQLTFKPINNDYDTIKATILRKENSPEIVYKYRSISDKNIEALSNNILMAVAPSKLNDPYESASYVNYKNRVNLIYKSFVEYFYKRTGRRLHIEIDRINGREELFNSLMTCLGVLNEDLEFWDNIFHYSEEMLEQKLLEIQGEIKQLNDEILRVCTFSQCNDSNPMWAQYAENFTGFCVGYNLTELREDPTDLFLPVRYEDTFIEINDTFFCKGEINKSFLLDSLTIKFSQWSYEKEWRLVQLTNNSNWFQNVKLPNPKVIILGKNISEKDQERLIKIADALHTKCVKQRERLEKYGYDLVEL